VGHLAPSGPTGPTDYSKSPVHCREAELNSANSWTSIGCDVLVVGGGLAGCMAAINGARRGARVVLAEKADTRRSGAAGTGNDHFGRLIIPGVSQWTAEELVRDHIDLSLGFVDPQLVYIVATEGFDRVHDLEAMGLNFKTADGKYELIPQLHKVPCSLHYAGRDVKPKLTAEAKRRGVDIFNRVAVTSLLSNRGRVVGATAFNVRTGEFLVFKANAVVLATGATTRLYPNTSGFLNNTSYPPHCSGDGIALAFRAGAELTNMEGTMTGFGPVGWQRAGLGSYWPARTVDATGQSIRYPEPGEGPSHGVSGPTCSRFPGSRATWLRSRIKEGTIPTPLYLDTPALNEEQIRRVEFGLDNEGGCWILRRYMEREGIDLRNYRIEHEYYQRMSRSPSGVVVNSDCRSSLAGLYAAGEVTAAFPFGSAPAAFTLGWRAGGNAAKWAAEVGPADIDKAEVAEEHSRVYALRERSTGTRWQDLLLAVQAIMERHMGDVRTEAGLKIGLSKIEDLRKEAVLAAANVHEQCRCLEAQNVLTVAEVMMHAALERRASSSYHQHFRGDYPEWDPPEWRKWIVVKRDGERIEITHRPIDLGRFGDA